MTRRANLVLVGPMGAGKSSVGRRLAERFGLRFVDVDQAIEARTGASVATIFECEGQAGFRAREREVLAELLAADGQIIATGGGSVLDADNRARMRERGFVVHLHADVPAQLRRLARDRSRPLLARPDREDALLALARERDPLYAQMADLRFDTGRRSCAQAATALAELLCAHWPLDADLRAHA